MTVTLDIPVMETERLRLRAHREADFAAYAAFYASDRTRFIGGKQDAREAWRTFTSDAGHWAIKGFGWWIVEFDGRPVGTVGFHHPPHQADIEIGWSLFTGAEGRGIAYEAAREALAWGWANLRPKRVVSYITEGNIASMRLAERLGAVREAEPAAHDPNSLVFRHAPPREAA